VSLETAANRAGVSVERLASWEEGGDDKPTLAKMRELAKLYRRPLAVFYLPTPPRGFSAMHDFRRTADGPLPQSPELRLAIRKARDRRDIAIELLTDRDEPIPTFSIGEAPEDAEEAGARIRSALGVAVHEQATWKDPGAALKGWREATERIGVLVFQMLRVELEEARGFSIADLPLPVVSVNIKDSANGRTFTLLHELAHLLRRTDGLCDLHDEGAAAQAVAEQYCNRAAAAALMPREVVLADDTVRAHGAAAANGSWGDNELRLVARRFAGASQEAVIRRLMDLGLSSQAFYRRKRAELADVYRLRVVKPEGFVPPHRLSLLSAGPVYTSLIVDAYDRRQITASDAADFLDVRVKHLAEARGDSRRRAG
jgi:Zn-dependent peptidase ImmA (M78 family)